jgi:hypothetical protein
LRLLAVAALAAALTACAPPLDFRLDPSFDDEAAEDIVQAAREWNAITNSAHQITFDGDSWFIEKAHPPGPWAGITYRRERRILLTPLPRGTSYRPLAKHELGHALGLRHLCTASGVRGEAVDGAPACAPGRSLGVMDPVDASDAFSDADLAECREAGACN